jgi:hypothetical protein
VVSLYQGQGTEKANNGGDGSMLPPPQREEKRTIFQLVMPCNLAIPVRPVIRTTPIWPRSHAGELQESRIDGHLQGVASVTSGIVLDDPVRHHR